MIIPLGLWQTHRTNIYSTNTQTRRYLLLVQKSDFTYAKIDKGQLFQEGHQHLAQSFSRFRHYLVTSERNNYGEANSTLYSNDSIFQKLKYVYWKVGSILFCLCSNWWERVARSPREKKSEFLVNLDRFSKYLKYLRNFKKRSKILN